MTLRADRSITDINREFYDSLWSGTRLERPQRFNTWPLISGMLPSAKARLEIGPGMRPRLPIEGTHFIDISGPVIEQLNSLGGFAAPGEITELPFEDGRFDLVAAFDVIEHVKDEQRSFSELSRVLKNNGILIFSVPLHADWWTQFDDIVGHVRRYESADLLALIAEHQLVVDTSAGFGMRPTNSLLLKWGMWWLAHRRTSALRWYNRVLMPLGIRFQKSLKFKPGMIDTAGVDGMILVCHRRPRS